LALISEEGASVVTRAVKTLLIVLAAAVLVLNLGSAAAQSSCGTHVVRAGENLFRIGLRYGVNYHTLAAFNGIPDPTRIYAGQTLRIPCGSTAQPVVVPAVINPQVVIPAAALQPQYVPPVSVPVPYAPPAYSSWGSYQPQPTNVIDCTGFRATSPVDGFPLGTVTFYWDAPRSAALVARYQVRVLNERGQTVLAREVLSPGLNLSADVGVGALGAGNRFSWYVVAVTADNRVCQSQVVSIPRAWSSMG
jgi:LysM repeat protein